MTLLLLLILVVTAVLIALLIRANRQRIRAERQHPKTEVKRNPNVECCGQHEVCEAETLLTLSEEIIYYSDEELDVYRARKSDAYAQSEVEEFREVLLELQLHEVAGWLKSLQLRGIDMPTEVREEALMIMQDFRATRAESRQQKEQQQ